MIRSTVILTAALLTLSFGAAHAANPDAMTLSTKGLDLTTPVDAAKFYKSLTEVSATLCGGVPSRYLGSQSDRFDICYKTTLDAAVVSTHATLISDIHQARYGARTQVASR